MIRLFAFFMIFSLFANAEETILLNTHIKMIPKIMALDSQALSHNGSNKAILAVVYDNNQKNNAQFIADEINKNYNGKVANLFFNAVAVSADELIERHDIAFAYLTHMNVSSVIRSANWGISNSVPVFSYDVSDMDHKVLGSITLERNTVIYISKNILKAGRFRFNDALFQIARLVE